MPYINVDEAYILDNTGLQVDQSVDYANANSNRNLLDNPWWGSNEVINQRGVAAGGAPASNVYTIDRWMFSAQTSGSLWNWNSVGMGFNPMPSSDGILFKQKLPTEVWDYIKFKTCTASARLADIDSTIVSGSVMISSASNSYFYRSDALEIYCDTSGNFVIHIIAATTIRAVKLELGSYSTLINDTPPDYGEELRKCQYYYREIKCTTTGYAMIGFATATTAFQACLPYVMRVRPSITYSGSLTAYYAGGNSAVTAVAANAEFTNSIQVAFTTTGLTAGSIVALAMGSGAKLMFSADL